MRGAAAEERRRGDHTLAFARPETRAYLRADYESGPWTAMFRGTWTGTQDLARFYDYANKPRYNFDGTPKMDKSPSYWTVDMRGEYRINKQWGLYLGVDNLFNRNYWSSGSGNWLYVGGPRTVTLSATVDF